jgi:hypothetical protein
MGRWMKEGMEILRVEEATWCRVVMMVEEEENSLLPDGRWMYSYAIRWVEGEGWEWMDG